MKKIRRREFIGSGIKGAAALGALGAVDLAMFVRQAVAAGADFSGIRNLASPLLAAPAMLTMEDSGFGIKLKSPDAKLLNAALVSADGTEMAATVETAEDGWRAALPPGAAPGVYGLKITSLAGGEQVTESQPRAVALYKEFKEDFDFVFISDIHFGEHDGKVGDVVITPEDEHHYRLRARALMEVEKHNPEFIVFGGDMVLYPKSYHLGYPEVYAYLLHFLKSPMHILPGNHDMYHMEVAELGGKHVYGKEYWDKYFGVYYHSFDYGNFHVSCVNTTDWPDEYIHWGTNNTTSGSLLSVGIQKEQFMWMKSDLEAAQAAGSNSIVCGHIPFHNIASGKRLGLPPQNMPGASEEKIMGLLNATGVKDIFVGHLHMNDVKALEGGVTENMIRNVGGDYLDGTVAGFAVAHVRAGKLDGYDLVELKA